jgi:hypothetical protein
MYKTIFSAVVLAASFSSAAHAADQDNSRVSQQEAAQAQLPSGAMLQQSHGLTRQQVYDQLVEAEKDGTLTRLNNTVYKGH